MCMMLGKWEEAKNIIKSLQLPYYQENEILQKIEKMRENIIKTNQLNNELNSFLKKGDVQVDINGI